MDLLGGQTGKMADLLLVEKSSFLSDLELFQSSLGFYWNTTMVFCYQNCSDLLRENVIVVIEEKLLKFKAEGQEFSKKLRSLEQFIQTVKGQNNFR